MPELPEVETIRYQLASALPFNIDACFFSPLASRLIKQLDFDPTGFCITQIKRHAKWLIFELQPEGIILSHLGMSGSWRISQQPIQDKHKHIEFIDQTQKSLKYLSYIDPRRFGHFYILSNNNFKKKQSSFDIDITSPHFDENHIAELFFKFPKRIIKSFLLDQKAFPGIGNYMASEICARSGILPMRRAGELEARDIIKIKAAIALVVKEAIETNGTTFGGGYRDANGAKGEGLKNLMVFYQKYCRICHSKHHKTKVIKITLAGRGTYYCPQCQK